MSSNQNEIKTEKCLKRFDTGFFVVLVCLILIVMAAYVFDIKGLQQWIFDTPFKTH